jgi:alpha-tubulin suppressor-like RCC1 family protein
MKSDAGGDTSGHPMTATVWGRVFRDLTLCTTVAACGTGTGPRGGITYVQVSAGRAHTCAVTASQRAYCWGSNPYGALGDGSTEPRASPVPVTGALRFQSISAGYDYTCAIATSGVVYCWGENFGGQLGDGTTAHHAAPVAVWGSRTFRSVSAGEAHTCGVTTAGETFCWGAAVGPDPDGAPLPNQLVPTTLGTPSFAEISSGYEIVCALTAAGAPYCWGLFPPGVRFADTTQTSAGYPLPVEANGVALVAVSAAIKHACGLAAGGVAYCWGRNGSGQLGDGSVIDTGVPQPVSGALRFASLSARGPNHSCGITLDGAAFCWGSNALAQLGTGAGSGATVPVEVAGDLRFVSLSAGFFHTCGVTTDGTAYCWGYGAFGQLGTGRFQDEPTPAAVVSPGAPTTPP